MQRAIRHARDGGALPLPIGVCAKDLLERSLWLAPFDFEVYAMVADACQKMGDEAGAKQWDARYKKLLKISNPQTPLAEKVTP